MQKIDRSIFAGLDLFAELSTDDQDKVLEAARSSRIEKNSSVFEQGGDATHFFLLINGHIRVVRTTPDGQQIIARYINPGEIFGIAPAIGRTTYPATAVAADECLILAWPTSIWSEISAKFPSLVSNTYKVIGERLQETQERVVELSTAQVEQRVANAVLRLVKQTGRKTAEGLLIDFPISRQDIAEMTGTTLHQVSRLLSAWEEQGLIKSGRQKITVTNAHKLFLIADGRKSS